MSASALRGSELSKLTSSNIVAYVDVSKFTSAGMYNQSVSIQFPLGSNTSSISVTATSPRSISFDLEKTSSKTVEIKGKFTGTVAEGLPSSPCSSARRPSRGRAKQ